MVKQKIFLIIELILLIITTIYLIINWNNPVTTGLNVVSLFWIELVYLLYVNKYLAS